MKGFTLVELLVGIAIIGIISTLVFVNVRIGSPSRELGLQADNLASLLRQAQTQSLAGYPFNGTVPKGGYGVHIPECESLPCSVTLFADINSNLNFEAEELVNTVNLGTNVLLTVPVELDIIFKPPRPFICFDTDCSSNGEVDIELTALDVFKQYNVNINKGSGSISVMEINL